MLKRKLQVISVAIVALMVLVIPVEAMAFQVTNKDMPLSSGVQYKKYASGSNSVNHLAVNLQDPYTAMKIGLPNPINSLATTTAIANRDSVEGHRVVGAINAGFFEMSSSANNYKMPMYLLSQGNEIFNGGIISDASSFYVSSPIAFGIKENGDAEIESFDFDINLTYNNETYEASGLNRERRSGEAIVFTPQHYKSATGTNEFGMEIVVETEEPITSNYFGQTLTGKVTEIRKYGDTKPNTIPKNGFVLATNGSKWSNHFGKIKKGETLSVGFEINKIWKNSQFMLGSGPMLVRDGKRYITMNTNSSRAKAIVPRSAVAISADKKQVHLVTVEKMNLTQFADYLVKLGVDRAINLDGGGSTTMGIRNYGSNTVVLANSPSGGTERKISTILEAVSTAPTGKPAIISASRDKVGTLLVGTTVTVGVNYILDAHYNPVSFNPSQVTLSSNNNLVSTRGTTYTAVSPGEDRVIVKYDTASQSFPVSVVAAPTTLSIGSAKTVTTGGSISFSATAKDAAGNNLIYNANQLAWSVEGDIGKITSSGKFTAGNKPGKGKVTAQLGTKKVSVDVEVQAPASDLKSPFTDISDEHVYVREIVYLTSNGYINGYEDGSFKPSQNLTRAHAAVLISRALNLDLKNVTDPGFTDVPKTHRYYKEIAAVANARIVGGKENNLYDPNGTLTRAQMAAILTNAYKLTGTSAISFSDVKPDYWAHKPISSLTYNKITTGYEDGTFKPSQPVTRIHFSVFLYRSIHR